MEGAVIGVLDELEEEGAVIGVLAELEEVGAVTGVLVEVVVLLAPPVPDGAGLLGMAPVADAAAAEA